MNPRELSFDATPDPAPLDPATLQSGQQGAAPPPGELVPTPAVAPGAFNDAGEYVYSLGELLQPATLVDTAAGLGVPSFVLAGAIKHAAFESGATTAQLRAAIDDYLAREIE